MRLMAWVWMGCTVGALAQAPDPAKLKPEGYLSDFAQVVDAGTRAKLNQFGSDFLIKTKVGLAVATVPGLRGEPIEEFANKLYHQWGIGQKDTSEGVLVVLSVRDRRTRIEIGYGSIGEQLPSYAITPMTLAPM